MLNALIQLSTFAYGMVFNFLLPYIYGLDAYGEFVAQNAVIFLLYRAMAIIREPLIRFTSPPLLLANSLTLNVLIILVFLIVERFIPMGSPYMLAGLLVNGSCLLTMQAMKLRRSFIVSVAAMAVCLAGLMLWSKAHGFNLSLTQVVTISVWVVSALSMLYLFMHGAVVPGLRELKVTVGQVMHQVPRIISITAVMNMLTSASPLFLVNVLTSHDMGLFKVMTSVIQSATIVFPVSTQAVLTSFVTHPHGVKFYRLLSSIAMMYFAAACAGLVACALIAPSLVPYVGLAACLPAYYQGILLERHLTATHHIRLLVILNWAVVAAIALGFCLVTDLQEALLVYAGGFTLYALALGMTDRDFKSSPSLLIIFALCPLFVALMMHHIAYGILYAVLVAAIAAIRHLPTRADIKLLWNEM
jgi:hypothetical protein